MSNRNNVSSLLERSRSVRRSEKYLEETLGGEEGDRAFLETYRAVDALTDDAFRLDSRLFKGISKGIKIAVNRGYVLSMGAVGALIEGSRYLFWRE
jgi:hypothetical protein